MDGSPRTAIAPVAVFSLVIGASSASVSRRRPLLGSVSTCGGEISEEMPILMSSTRASIAPGPSGSMPSFCRATLKFNARPSETSKFLRLQSANPCRDTFRL